MEWKYLNNNKKEEAYLTLLNLTNKNKKYIYNFLKT